MVFFDLECWEDVLYKLEAEEVENGKVMRRFCAFTNCEMSDEVRKITGIGEEQTRNGLTEDEAVKNFFVFLKECGAVGERQKTIGGLEYMPLDCIGFGTASSLQKILFRQGFRVSFPDNKFRGDLLTFAKTYCNHLPIKSFLLSELLRYFGIKMEGLQSLYFLSQKLAEEKAKDIDAIQCQTLCIKLLDEARYKPFFPQMTARAAFDLARAVLADSDIFCDTILLLFKMTKHDECAADDWCRVLSAVEREVALRRGKEGKFLFEKSLPESLRELYPSVLSYHILDGEGKVGANLIEIAYRGTKILIECGTELEPSEYGKALRMAVLQSRYDACIISHYHADHAGLIDKIEKKTPTYIGTKAKKILQTVNHKRYENVRTYDKKFAVGDIFVTPYLCDHSAMDSYMLLFEAGGKRILYTGDFRAHGRKSFTGLLSSLPRVSVLICEHTNGGIKQRSERTLEKQFAQIMRGGQDVYVLTSKTNFDRIVSIYKACLRTKRLLIVDKMQADVLNAAGGGIKHPRSHKNIKIAGEEGFSYAHIARLKAPYTMLVRSSMGQELEILLQKRPEAQLIYSLWKGYMEREDMKAFLDMFKKRQIAVQVLHTSGHADGEAIEKLISKTAPQEVKFVHGEPL